MEDTTVFSSGNVVDSVERGTKVHKHLTPAFEHSIVGKETRTMIGCFLFREILNISSQGMKQIGVAEIMDGMCPGFHKINWGEMANGPEAYIKMQYCFRLTELAAVVGSPLFCSECLFPLKLLMWKS